MRERERGEETKDVKRGKMKEIYRVRVKEREKKRKTEGMIIKYKEIVKEKFTTDGEIERFRQKY